MADTGWSIVVRALPRTTSISKGQDTISKNISTLRQYNYYNVVFVESDDHVLQVLANLSVKYEAETGYDV